MYYVPGFTNYLNSIGERPVYSDPTAEVPIVNVLDPAYQGMYSEPDYSTPASQPVYAEPVYTPPPPPPPPPPPVYTPPTPQPVYSEPVYSEPTTRGILSDPAFAERFSAMAPMQPEPSVPTVDLGGWNLEDFRKQFAPTGPSNADAVNAWLAEQAAQGREYVYNPKDDLAYSMRMNSLVPSMFPTSGYASFDPNNPTASMLELFRFNSGATQAFSNQAPKIGYPDGNGGITYKNAFALPFAPGMTFEMLDKSGNVIGTASTADEMKNLVALSEKVPFYTMRQTAGLDINPNASGMLPQKTDYGSLGSLLVQMGALALPAAGGAVLGPLLAGGLGTSAAVGTGLGTALGSAASGVTAGKSIGDILKGAAISGLSAFAMSELLNSLGVKPPAAGDTTGSFQNDLMALGVDPTTASSIAANLGGNLGSVLPTDIVVSGNPAGLMSGAGGVFSGALTSALNAVQPSGTNYGDGIYDQTQEIVVEGARQPTTPTITPPLGMLAPDTVAPPESTIVVEGARKPTEPSVALPNPIVPPTVAPPESEIVVTGEPKAPSVDDRAAALTGTIAPILNAPTTSATSAETNKKLDLVDYLRLAGLGIGAIGSLFEGGGGQSNFRVPGGMGGLSPTFGARLPTANLPGLTGGTAAAPRTAANLGTQGLRTPQDYYRYGYGPEQSFFNYVPEGEKNTSTAYTGYAKGGFAVEGPGDGRDDKIPAMLSDGEYVIDAETVALLGNGSNKAGADMLDQFRVNVRKHKGRDLMRGEFSKNAKRPERYLAGGRA